MVRGFSRVVSGGLFAMVIVGCVTRSADEAASALASAFGEVGEYQPVALACDAGEVMTIDARAGRCTYRYVGRGANVAPSIAAVRDAERDEWRCEIRVSGAACDIDVDEARCTSGDAANGERACTPPAQAAGDQANPKDGRAVRFASRIAPNADAAQVECQRAYDRMTAKQKAQAVDTTCRQTVARLNAAATREPLICCVPSPERAHDDVARTDAGPTTCTPPEVPVVKEVDAPLCDYNVTEISFDPMHATPHTSEALARARTTVRASRWALPPGPADFAGDPVDPAGPPALPEDAGSASFTWYSCDALAACHLEGARRRCDPLNEPKGGDRAACPDAWTEASVHVTFGTVVVRDLPSDTLYGLPLELGRTGWAYDEAGADAACAALLVRVSGAGSVAFETLRESALRACMVAADEKESEQRGPLTCCGAPRDGGSGDGGTGGGDAGVSDAGASDAGAGDSGARDAGSTPTSDAGARDSGASDSGATDAGASDSGGR